MHNTDSDKRETVVESVQAVTDVHQRESRQLGWRIMTQVQRRTAALGKSEMLQQHCAIGKPVERWRSCRLDRGSP